MSGFIGENEEFDLTTGIAFLPGSYDPVTSNSFTWSRLQDIQFPVRHGDGLVWHDVTGTKPSFTATACSDNLSSGTGSFSFSDFPFNTGAPIVGSIASGIEAKSMPSNMAWELSARFARYEVDVPGTTPVIQSTRLLPDGNFWFGLSRVSTSNIHLWDYCVNVYAGASVRPVRGFPHQPNSVLIFERDTAFQFPPRPVFWRQGVWKNTNQLIRIQCVNKVIRYFVDDLLIYTSRIPFEYTDPVYPTVMFDCRGQAMISPLLITGTNVLVGNPIAFGPSTGADCAGPFPSPGGVPLPVNVTAIQGAVAQMPPLPQGPTDPIPVRFQEVAVNWGEFEQRFATGLGDVNTLQKTPIRRFEIEWDGLTPEQAGALDAHYERSHAGLSFTMTYRGEVLTNCRYMSYSRTDHTRYWVQSRQASIVRYP